MIQYKDWFIPELLTKFTIKKVRYETLAESYWLLQYKNYDPIFVYDKYFQTLEEDEKLIEKEIEAQIDVNVSRILPMEKREKKILLQRGSDEWGKHKPIVITGIYSDAVKSETNGEIYMDYKLDSIFPILITDVPENAKIGDWVTVAVEDAEIILPGRKNNLLN